MKRKLLIMMSSVFMVLCLFMITLNTVSAGDDSNISSSVEYNDEYTKGNIKFELKDLEENLILEKIGTPDGSFMDIEDSYEISKNGSYEFTFDFKNSTEENESTTINKVVKVTEIKDEVLDIPISTSEIILDDSYVFSTDGIVLKNYQADLNARPGEINDRYFAVYLRADEHFKFTAEYGGAYNPNELEEGKYYLIDPDGDQISIDYPTPADSIKTMSVRADKEGIYIVKPVLSESVPCSAWHNLNFNIEDVDGNYKSGRVWNDIIDLRQSGRLDNNGEFVYKEDFTFYHVTALGYIYKQDLIGYSGFNSVVYSDPVGILDKRSNNCEPVYGDVPFWSTTIYTGLRNTPCENNIKPNHIFLEKPDNSLPKNIEILKINPDGSVAKDRNGQNIRNNIFVLPLISDNTPIINSLAFARDKYNQNIGTFTADIINVQGFATLQIKIDDDRDEIVDRVIEKEMLVNENGLTTYQWDGLDDSNTLVPITSKLSATIKIERAGEIHFVSSDVEVRGGLSVERLTAIDPNNIGDSTLYYSTSTLPIDLSASPNIVMPNPISGSYNSLSNPTHHSWNFISNPSDNSLNTYATRLANFEGRIVDFIPGTLQDPNLHCSSFGDGNNIDDWAFEPVNISLDVDLDIYEPVVTIEKEVNKEISKVGDELIYTLKVTNNENYDVEDYKVTDTIEDLDKVDYVLNSIEVDGVNVTDAVDNDYGSFDGSKLEVNYPILAAGAESNITFKVTVLEEAKGQEIINIALLEDPLNPDEPIPSNEVETKIPSLSINKEVDKLSTKVGETLTYNINIKNNSIFEVNNYKVTDTIEDLDKVDYVLNSIQVDGVNVTDAVDNDNGSFDGSKLEVTYPILDAGAESIITFKVTVLEEAKGQVISNIALLEDPLDPDNPTPSNEIETQISYFLVNKKVDKESAKVGDILTYTIDIKNNSTFEVRDYVLKDEILDSSKAEYIKGSLEVDGINLTDVVDEDNGSFLDGTIKVDYKNLKPNQESTITFKVTVLKGASGKDISNVALLEDPLDPDNPIPSNEVISEVESNVTAKPLPKTGVNGLLIVVASLSIIIGGTTIALVRKK